MAAYRSAQERFDLRGGYRWRDHALDTIRGLGFGEDELDRPLSTFSGGELTRGSLARALTGEPDLLLLDEPTNHLDIASLEWLEDHLNGLDAAIVLVAHDRWFLEAVGTSVLELEAGRSRFFPGTWAAWRKEQAMRECRWARRSRSRRPRSPGWSASWSASGPRPPRPARPSRGSSGWRRSTRSSATPATSGCCRSPSRSPSARAAWCSISRAGGSGARPVLIERADMHLERGEHVTLVGGNGSGKTTLIQTLTGRAERRGKLHRPQRARGLRAQHAEGLSEDGTLLEATQRATGLTPGKARALLGVFLFSGDDARSPWTGCRAASASASRSRCW